MAEREKQDSLIVDNTYRRMSLQQEIPSKKERFQNVGSLRLKISIICLSTFYWGYCLAYLSTLSTQTIIQQFGPESQNTTVKGFLIGVLTLGGAAGAFSSPFWMKCLTRKNLILLFSIGALIIEGVIQYPNIYCLFICRAFQGYFVGNFMALVPIYINELSPKQIVGIFGVYTQLFAMFGVVVAYALGIILTKAGVQSHIMWRIMFGLDILTISFVIMSCVLGIIPESPNSLIMKGEKDEAKKVINMFVKDEYVEEVFKEKLLEVEHEKNSSSNSSDVGLNYSRKAYFIGFLLPLMQQLTGINAITTQIGGIVSKHNADFGYYLPLIINFIQFAATFGAITALNLFGRKTILLAGNFGLGICDILLGILFIFIEKFSAAFWLVFAILMIYMAIYSTTIGPVVWMYVPEIIPAKVVPFATTLNWLGCSFCLIILPIINESLGSSAVFFIFGGLTLFIGVINMFGIVETKGLNLKQICAAYQ